MRVKQTAWTAVALLLLAARCAFGAETVETTQADAVSEVPEIVDVPPSSRRARLYAHVSTGFAYRWAIEEHLLSGVFEAELGSRDHRLAGGGRVRIEAGKMLAGLSYQVVAFGPSLWLPAAQGRIHFGMGVDTGVLLLNRKTEANTTMWTVLWGGRIEIQIDLLKLGQTGRVYAATGLLAQALTQAPFLSTLATGVVLGYRP